MVATSDGMNNMDIKDSPSPPDDAVQAHWMLTVLEDRAESAGAPSAAADKKGE